MSRLSGLKYHAMRSFSSVFDMRLNGVADLARTALSSTLVATSVGYSLQANNTDLSAEHTAGIGDEQTQLIEEGFAFFRQSLKERDQAQMEKIRLGKEILLAGKDPTQEDVSEKQKKADEALLKANGQLHSAADFVAETILQSPGISEVAAQKYAEAYAAMNTGNFGSGYYQLKGLQFLDECQLSEKRHPEYANAVSGCMIRMAQKEENEQKTNGLWSTPITVPLLLGLNFFGASLRRRTEEETQRRKDKKQGKTINLQINIKQGL